MSDDPTTAPRSSSRWRPGWCGWLLVSLALNLLLTTVTVNYLLGGNFIATQRIECRTLRLHDRGKEILYAGPAPNDPEAHTLLLSAPNSPARVVLLAAEDMATVAVTTVGKDGQRRFAVVAADDGAAVRTEIAEMDGVATELYAEPDGWTGVRIGGGQDGWAGDWASEAGARSVTRPGPGPGQSAASAPPGGAPR